MSSTAIHIENLGKQYRIGARQQRHRTLRDALTGAVKRAFRGGRGAHETIWALRGITVDIAAGEAVGVVGRNGAGKSTLLKILSRITDPTEGRVEIHGRVGSLLEVGTGFHPELTGRENIFLNGAILGMRRTEIERNFDEIVAFAEVEKFIDTPVKHYSSGMYVRLAFAVAAHLEPEILIVDEVLAVGDAAFQKKCLGKMGDVAQEGRTVLFVSHNMGAVARLCQRGIMLRDGMLVEYGPIDRIVDLYTSSALGDDAETEYPADESKAIQIDRARLLDHAGAPSTQLDRSHAFAVEIEFTVRTPVTGAHVGVMLDKADGTPVCHSADNDTDPEQAIERRPGRYRTTVEMPGGLLNAGIYQIRLGIAKNGGAIYDYREPFTFQLNDNGTFASVGEGRQRAGILAIPLEWNTRVMGEG